MNNEFIEIQKNLIRKSDINAVTTWGWRIRVHFNDSYLDFEYNSGEDKDNALEKIKKELKGE